MVCDMVMRRIMADAGRAVAREQRPARLPSGATGRATLGALLLLVLTAGAALGEAAAVFQVIGGAVALA